MRPHYAIFGGSFNPIHQGHVSVVQQLLSLGIDKIIIIPTSRSPFKEQVPLLPATLRMEMVRCTFQDWERVEISDLEIKSSQIQYTYHTLKLLQIQHPGTIWHLVLGWDSYQEFPRWKEAQQIIASTSLWVVQRSGLSLQKKKPLSEQILAPLSQWFEELAWDPHQQVVYHRERKIVRYLEFDTPSISSTDIRAGRAGVEWLPLHARALYTDYLHQHPEKKEIYEKY